MTFVFFHWSEYFRNQKYLLDMPYVYNLRWLFHKAGTTLHTLVWTSPEMYVTDFLNCLLSTWIIMLPAAIYWTLTICKALHEVFCYLIKSLLQSSELGNFISILQMRKFICKEKIQHGQGQLLYKWQSQLSNSGLPGVVTVKIYNI